MVFPSEPRWLTLDAVAHYPRPGTAIPASLAFSPDGRLLTYLWSERGDLVRDLWAFDLETEERRVLVHAPATAREERLPAEEGLRRERLRQRESGITRYSWAKDADRILLPIDGQLYVTSSHGEAPRAVAHAPVGEPALAQPPSHPLPGQLAPRRPSSTAHPNGSGASPPAAPSRPEPVADAVLTPDGVRVVFVRGRELWVADVDPARAQAPPPGELATAQGPGSAGPLAAAPSRRQLTTDASDTVSNGLAEYIAQEEMRRYAGFWISPGGDRVAYCQVDEGHIPAYPIIHQGEAEWRLEHHRYPFAGGENARVRLGVIGLDGGATRWLDLGPEQDIYVARVDWGADDELYVQVQSRDQRRLELRRYDPASGVCQILHEENGSGSQPPGRMAAVRRADSATLRGSGAPGRWVNLHDDLRFVGHDGSFVWSSERDGFRHLWLHDPVGKPVRKLTDGQWAVDGVVHVDEERRCVYFLAGHESPLERCLYRVSLDGGETEPLTEEAGFHSAVFSRDGTRYAHVFETRSQPPSVVVRWVDQAARTQRVQDRRSSSPPTPTLPRKGGVGSLPSPSTGEGEGGGDVAADAAVTNLRDAVLVHAAPAAPLPLAGERAAPSRIQPPEIVQLEASDGAALYGALYRPLQPSGPSPTIVAVYGGPHAQTVREAWELTVDLRGQYLASLGFVVFKLDNRGSARRGVAFEATLHRRLGSIEIEDQVQGVRWLVAQGLADPERIGIYGWSYGGYLTVMGLLHAPEVFKVGVAGAPVADWDGYDTHYTERYMETPAANRDGYRESSAITHAHRLQGKLLLVHGMVDENVHFRHTARLIAALEAAGRPFDLLVFPGERHMPRSEDARRYLEERIAAYFLQHL